MKKFCQWFRKVSIRSFPLFFIASCFGQEDTTILNFLGDVIKRDSDSACIFYTDKVHDGMFGYMLERQNLKRRIRAKSSDRTSITLTKSELRQFQKDMASSRAYLWTEDLFAVSSRIPNDSMYEFLTGDQNRSLYIFSRPSFIREHTVALFYVARLCCGGINGPVTLSLYRKQNGNWEKWMPLFEGAF